MEKIKERDKEKRWKEEKKIGEKIKKVGMKEKVKRRRREIDKRRKFEAITAANREWETDLKGWLGK